MRRTCSKCGKTQAEPLHFGFCAECYEQIKEKYGLKDSLQAKTKEIPVILCDKWESGLKFWCEYCRCWHYHGEGDGKRVAHCGIKSNSPYKNGEYYLKLKEDDKNEVQS